jgi:glycerate kinase
LIKHALDLGAKKILVCVGGSATTDGASGLLQALGVEWLDSAGRPLEGIPGSLTELADINLSNLDPRIRSTEIVVLCDVRNRLLGINGSAAIFGPQKGADDTQVKKLELCLGRLREMMLEKTGKEMDQVRGGAAGGVAAGMAAFLGAKLVDGIDYFLDLTRFEDVLKDTQAVITGEGSLDLQTLEGKAPFGVAKRAKQLGIPVIALAGKIDPVAASALSAYFDAMFTIQPELTDLSEAMKHTARDLTGTAKNVGNLISLFQRN